MNKSMTVSLSADHAAFVAREIEADRYATPAEVVSAGLDALAMSGWDDDALRAALKEGEESGECVEWNLEEFLATESKRAAQRKAA